MSELMEITQSIANTLGGGRSLFSAFATVAELWEIAEDAIREAQHKHPRQKELLWNCFSLLNPSDILWEMETIEPRLYRHHCDELLERVAAGSKLNVLTDAEILCILVQASLIAPLDQDSAAAYFRLFREIYPNELPDLDELRPSQSWEGAIDTILERIRRKEVERNELPEEKQLALGLFAEAANVTV